MARTKVFDQDAVLEKAMQVFWCKGYHATSAQDLVDQLGISRSSLYDTYSDKRTLFIQSLQLYRTQMAGGMIRMIEKSSNIEHTIEQLFKMATSDALEDQLARGCFMTNTTIELAPHDEEVARIVNQNMQDIENALCKAITKGQEQGVLNAQLSALSLARFIFNNISGIRVAAKSGAEKTVYDDIVRVVLSALKKP